ncbi:MAG: hypothetical protein IJH53_06600 [Oscillospiraceae bacterium]|nr:hypothetical protein [Oscillospiraceae bacterium]
MTNNTVIRLITLTFIVFCFFAMFVLASFSAKADLRPASAGTGFIELSSGNGEAVSELESLFCLPRESAESSAA